MKKYYYLKDGEKRYYEGKMIHNVSDNTIYGFLIKSNISENQFPLTYHPAVIGEEGWNSYFTYKDSDNNICKYTDLKSKIKKNHDNTYYLAKFKKEEIELKKYEKIPGTPKYYTYINEKGEEVKYKGDPKDLKYDKKLKKYYFEK